MSIKENWLVAWSTIRVHQNNIVYEMPRMHEEIKELVKEARICIWEREKNRKPMYKKMLEDYLHENGYKKEWTGYKNTWVKMEESDVPF